MIIRTHIEDAGGANEAFGFLDLVADFSLVRPTCPFDSINGDEQPVISMAAESRDRSIFSFVLLL